MDSRFYGNDGTLVNL